MNFIKKHYLKIILVLFVFLYMSSCIKSCNKSNTIKHNIEIIDSLKNERNLLTDSIKYLNNEIIIRDIKLENLNTRLTEQKQTNNKLLNRKNIINIKNELGEKTNEQK